MEHYRELSLAAQTAYAQLIDAVQAQSLQRSVADLNGSFAAKTVKGKTYRYFQYRDVDGAVRQLYLGPDDEAMQALITRAHDRPRRALEPLARSAIALGCERILPKHFRILRRLSEYGFFHAGGVLVGTHAFLAFGNMLGVDWAEEARTQDVDLAHAGKNISIALPASIKVDVHGAVQSLDMGFLPIGSFGGRPGATYLSSKEADLRLDFLTTLHRGGDTPVSVPNLNVTLQPLKFMEFSLEQTTQAALFCEEGVILVNVPAPARYAVHKLLVWGERNQAFRSKANKDLAQAAALIAYFRDHRPAEMRRAWRDLISRGRGWQLRGRQGARAVGQIDASLAALLPLVVKAGASSVGKRGPRVR